MREKITDIFFMEISPLLNKINSIAIVGGNKLDPESQILERAGFKNIDYYGIDPGLIKLDLNLAFTPNKKYDLVICSQVLEHIYDVKQGLENLANLTSTGGYLWIGCPASNRPHGSPFYFSAGYHTDLITNLLIYFSVNVVKSGFLGSKRLYFMTHALRIWPSTKELEHPILFYNFARRDELVITKFIRFFYDLPGRFYSCALSNKTTTTIDFATESWVLGKK